MSALLSFLSHWLDSFHCAHISVNSNIECSYQTTTTSSNNNFFSPFHYLHVLCSTVPFTYFSTRTSSVWTSLHCNASTKCHGYGYCASLPCAWLSAIKSFRPCSPKCQESAMTALVALLWFTACILHCEGLSSQKIFRSHHQRSYQSKYLLRMQMAPEIGGLQIKLRSLQRVSSSASQSSAACTYTVGST